MDWLSLLGRNSLLVFLVGFYLYFLAFHFMSFPLMHLWPLYFALSIGFITLCALQWEIGGYNRWFNVLDWRLRTQQSATAPRPIMVRDSAA